MTRHQVWKARERARFRLMAEGARVKKTPYAPYVRITAAGVLIQPPRLYNGEKFRRLNDATVATLAPYKAAAQRGIKEPFLG